MNAYRPALILFVALLAATAGAMALGLVEPPAALRGDSAPEPPPAVVEPAEPEPQLQLAATTGDGCRFCGRPHSDCPAPPPDEEIRVDLNVMEARLPEGAGEPELAFDLRARWPGYNGSEEIVMPVGTSEQRSLELGVCSVEVEPALGERQPSLRVPEDKARDWTYTGRYSIALKDPDGRLIDSFELDSQEFRRLGTTSTDHYTLNVIPGRGRFGDRYDVYAGKHETIRGLGDPLFSYEVTIPGMDQAQVDDGSGTQTYVFPRPSLRIYTNAVVEELRLARAEKRPLRYGWTPPKALLASASGGGASGGGRESGGGASEGGWGTVSGGGSVIGGSCSGGG